MHVKLDELNEEQRLWYGYLVASATKADGEVNQSEVEFLINTLHFLNPSQKGQVQNYLKTSGILPDLGKVPSGLNKIQLANIFTDLIWVIVSDGKLTRDEKSFLTTVGNWFKFPDGYLEKLLKWGEQMLVAEKYRRQVIGQI